MIVSASYKTDIPAFYRKWFLHRLEEGHCRVRNPVSGRIFRVSLRREDVDGFVFWTKNPWPFMDALTTVRSAGFRFYMQFTITPYERAIERSVIAPLRAVEAARSIAREHGLGSVVWRYDPIILSPTTPVSWHIERFRELCSGLEGTVDEVATKFVIPHVKTRRNLASAGLPWRTPSPDEGRRFLAQLSEIAGGHGMRLTVCAQPDVAGTLPKAVCIDADRLRRLGATIGKTRTEANRPDCLCHEARDIGEYDTCPQGCAYCYATSHQRVAVRRHSLHDPDADSLIPLPAEEPRSPAQATLFDVG